MLKRLPGSGPAPTTALTLRRTWPPALGLALIVSATMLACGTASPAEQPTSESTAATRQADELPAGSAAANLSGTTRGQDGEAAGKRPSNSTTAEPATGRTSGRQGRPTPASDASAANAATGVKPEGTSAQKPSGPDVDALTALYRATDGDNWKSNTNWLSDQPVRHMARRLRQRRWTRQGAEPQ